MSREPLARSATCQYAHCFLGVDLAVDINCFKKINAFYCAKTCLHRIETLSNVDVRAHQCTLSAQYKWSCSGSDKQAQITSISLSSFLPSASPPVPPSTMSPPLEPVDDAAGQTSHMMKNSRRGRPFLKVPWIHARPYTFFFVLSWLISCSYRILSTSLQPLSSL